MDHEVADLCRLAEAVVVAGGRRDVPRAYDAAQAAFVSLDDWRRFFATTEATSVHWYEAGYWLRRHHSVAPGHPDADRLCDTTRRFLESLVLRSDAPAMVRETYATALSAWGVSGGARLPGSSDAVASAAASRHQSPRRPAPAIANRAEVSGHVAAARPAIMTPQVSSSLHLQHSQPAAISTHAPRSGAMQGSAAAATARNPQEPSVIPAAGSPSRRLTEHVEHPSGVVASVRREPREDRYTSPTRRAQHQQQPGRQSPVPGWHRPAMSPHVPAGGPVSRFHHGAAQQFGAPQDEARAMMAAQARFNSAGPWRAIDTPPVEGVAAALPHPAPPSVADETTTPTRAQPARNLVGSPRTPPAVTSVSTATPLPVQVEYAGPHPVNGLSHRPRERMRVREDPQPRGDAGHGY